MKELTTDQLRRARSRSGGFDLIRDRYIEKVDVYVYSEACPEETWGGGMTEATNRQLLIKGSRGRKMTRSKAGTLGSRDGR